MALYQYNLYLVRTARPDGLLAALRRNGLLGDAESDHSALLPEGAHALVREGLLRTGGGIPLQVVALLIEDEYVNLFTHNFQAFASWLEEVARTADLEVALMLGEADASPSNPDLNAFLTALIEESRLIAAPALLWTHFPASGQSACTFENPLYWTKRSAGLGCLYALVDVADDGSFEILEPGPDQRHLLFHWTRPHG